MTLSELHAKVAVSVRARGTRPVGIDRPVDDLDQAYRYTVAFGNSADQADELYHQTRTIPGSGIDDVDISGGLVDALGGTFAPTAEIVAMMIEAHEGNTLPVTVGGSPSNPWTAWFAASNDVEQVPAGGVAIHVAPNTGLANITAGTADILRITGAPGDKYDLILLGR